MKLRSPYDQTSPVTGKQVLSALKRKGFNLVHIRESHHYIEHPQTNAIIAVPVHTGAILKPKTLKSILDQAGLSIEEFADMI